MTGAGQFRCRVTLQQKGPVVDDQGVPNLDSWVDVATVWASVEPQTLRAREFVGSGANEVEKIVVVRIRYRPDVTEQNRVMYNGHVYRIEAVVDDHMQHRELQLYCSEVAPGG
ncbi:head-tail adaptor protein [Alicyclobacillus contaminans]|uniref:phage head closure protein n=1 Tax=Alicyclobacillus contaminans TaxID=392016 RepID=UPI000417FEE0|nr:phage head closure protein [Alicyclobacillus contaminans]GMA52065.1 head-tail adaptor protein [Alicyclobacillus contaminans]